MPAPLPRWLFALALLLLAGCESEPPFNVSVDPIPPVGATAFDPARCGRIEGRVTWPGPLPKVDNFIFGMPKPDGSAVIRMMPNPNRPRIDDTSKAIAGAVVFLRGVNPAAAKPWDHPPARVELRDYQIVIAQGEGPPRRCGFVRRGDAVTIQSAEPIYHAIRARGAAYFSLTFPEPNQPLSRKLDRPGRVELTSAAGHYWASADLFVDDHPYYTVTDADGRFRLTDVPAGDVELVVWLPGWRADRQERDPESGLIYRQTYSPPIERTRKLTVTPGMETVAEVTVP